MVTIGEMASELGARASGEGLERAVCAGRSAVTHDSRRVVPGGIFVAIQGAHSDGNRFVGEAAKRGAIAIVSERDRPADYTGAWLQVEDARATLARAAALAQGHPSRRLRVVGITGTNGKTTTAHLVAGVFGAAGEIPAMMGTISYRIGDEILDAEHTTPEASEIQYFLRRAADTGARSAVMEVSSHALDLRRADAIEFAVAAFTNLTQDHLDYHATMDDYFAAKRRLFDGGTGARPRHSVVNIDDPRGAELLALGAGAATSYGLGAEAQVTTSAVEFGFGGLKFTARTPAGDISIESPLVGRPHVYNILCSIGAALALDYPRDVIARGVAGCGVVAGRFERVNTADDDVTVIVDYAHTPDALSSVLSTVREVMRGGRLITVMGCGGDRDKSKRPLMGEAAGRLSDWVIATSDNPRSEEPNMILTNIKVGLERIGGAYELIVDRREAIFRAITRAAPGDVIVIAGKGHETYQILPDGRIHFDDRETAREALASRCGGEGES
ncbi:MAG: UDP-N-acetylmuramoyl-L-alanyl-D-glutamate--2,6-diaminopimelate ligase [Acidobacteria bacterium]|nr:UDP-N-acetylmuramoyl-L-alanyl-D-glutamate--2,6-diaminopimelate ligase [Acidobacteriota bacterium]MCW5970525.1 UDP-N-acetylmuramoyl-L-alanyl-D-glutamate--2,6-diaminopimelate ligase [Blastocatellales bacterium]